jgi:glyoxylase-like metal-dependent hydrolase (beta-lactamase superfamily II)
MIRESAGKISDELYALGSPALPAYLLMGKTPVLFDAGMTFMGPSYLKDLKKCLGDVNRLAYNFLTHSHFDHSGAAPFLKRNIPGLKVVASKLAAEVFKRPNAIQLIQSLSKGMEEAFRSQIGDADITFRGLELDRTLEDGDEIVLEDGIKIQVIATPGHTRDAVSYYIPRLKALVGGEAVGSLDRNLGVRSVFLSSYNDYLRSLEKLQDLEIEILLMGHAHVLTEGEARGIVARAIEATRDFKKRIEQELDFYKGDQEGVVKKIFREDYVEKKLIPQEERPYLINLTAQVKAIAERK